MANAEKWRPYVLVAAALAVIVTALICRREAPRGPGAGHSYDKCVKLANKLNAAAMKQIAAAPPKFRPALHSAIAQTNFQLYTLLKITPQLYFPDDTSIWDGLQQIGKDLGSVSAGVDPFARRTGRFIRGYVSTVGGLQGYSINVPEKYDGRRRFPLVVSLHGFGAAGRWEIRSAPEVPDAITAAPRGFGPTDFKFIGERDVIDVIRDVRRNYNIDADRVYLAGGSMGGTGSWSIAAHHPDIFAAIAPVAGNTDFRAWEQPEDLNPESSLEKTLYFQKAATSASFLAENLLNLPVYCLHGSDDPVVLAAHSRLMMRALKKAGNESVIYWEFPGFAHGRFPAAFTRERYKWLLSKRRVREPEHVIYKTASLRYPGAYWLVIEQRPDPLMFSRMEGKIEGDALNIATSNVSRFHVRTPSGLHNVDQLAVMVDGSLAYKGKPEPLLVFESRPEGWQRTLEPLDGIVKRPGLSGPIEDAFLSRFMLVHGNGDELRTGALDRLVRRWQPKVACPVKPESDVTDDDIAKYNLILMGNPETNPLMARVMKNLPIKIDGRTITCGHNTYEGDDLGLKMCFPNPLNPGRYVVVLASTGYNGMFGINSRFGNWFHWVVYNNRDWFDYAVFDDRTFGPESFLEVGFFDSQWALSDRMRRRRAADGAYRRRNVPALTSLSEAPGKFLLSELRPAAYNTQRGPIGFDQRPDGAPIVDAEKKEHRGLTMLSPGSITWRLDGRAKGMSFRPWLPPAPSRMPGSTTDPGVEFMVLGDGRRLYASGEMLPGELGEPAVVRLAGVKELTLRVSRAGGPRWIYLPVVWLDPIVRKSTP